MTVCAFAAMKQQKSFLVKGNIPKKLKRQRSVTLQTRARNEPKNKKGT